MIKQSNSANLDHLSTIDLAAHLGQLRLPECEPYRELIVARLTEAGKQVGPGAPLVSLLRMLGALWSPSDTSGQFVTTKPEGPAFDDVVLAR